VQFYIVDFKWKPLLSSFSSCLKMFLYSPKLLWHYRLCFKFINLFHALPCKWNNTNGLINYIDESSSSDKAYFRIWKLVNSVIQLQGVFFLLGYFQELMILKSETFGSFVIGTIMFICFELGAFLQFFILMRGKPLITYTNRFLKYFYTIQGKRK